MSSTASVQSSGDVLPVLRSGRFPLVAGGGAPPADPAALHRHPDEADLLALRGRRLGVSSDYRPVCSCMADVV